MFLLYYKAFHIIGVVVWFAGLFYLGRLFVYHRDAFDVPEPASKILKTKFAEMEKRLYYGITWPGLCITILFGVALIIEWGTPNWIQIKFGLVFLLVGYHLYCGNIRKKLLNENCRWNCTQLKLFNEIPTIFLFSIVFLVVFKEVVSWTFILIAIILLSLLIITTVIFIEKKNNYIYDKKKPEK